MTWWASRLRFQVDRNRNICVELQKEQAPKALVRLGKGAKRLCLTLFARRLMPGSLHWLLGVAVPKELFVIYEATGEQSQGFRV